MDFPSKLNYEGLNHKMGPCSSMFNILDYLLFGEKTLPKPCRVNFRFVPSQWEMALLCNDASHWLGASLGSTLTMADLLSIGPLGENLKCNSTVHFKQFLFWKLLYKKFCLSIGSLNSLRPSDAYMRQWNESSLVQVMACCLFGTKPLSEPMLAYSLLDAWEHISVIF